MRDLIALLDRYAPGCSNQIQGVSTAEIDFLEDAFGQPLPDVYRLFALEMGRDGGPLLANDILPRRFLFIFGDPDPLTRFHYWLELEAPSEDGDSQVVQSSYFQDAWKTKLIRSYVGLQEMLFDWAMEYVCVPSFPHRARYRQGDGVLRLKTAKRYACQCRCPPADFLLRRSAEHGHQLRSSRR
jgi:hypothetical protein